MQEIRQVTVYCASSCKIHQDYLNAAFEVGRELASAGIVVVYGGGAIGSMGELANGAISSGGRVKGIIPEFMDELEWGHPAVDELQVVSSMHERKEQMLQQADAAIALPGGTGTLEELVEALTWKRLGLFFKPIILVNTRGFYDGLIKMLEQMVDENFMDERHLQMWSVVQNANEVVDAIRNAPLWDENAREFATPKPEGETRR